MAYPFTPEERAVAAKDRRLHFIGTPKQVKKQILDFAKATGTDEIMIISTIHGHEERMRSYELIAEVFNQTA